MDADIRIRTVGPGQQNLLVQMYESFEPLGVALGLPPFTEESRFRWIGLALRNEINVVAFSADGRIAGHCFLAADGSGSAEMAIFVHQEYRRKGIGAALVKAVLDAANTAGLARVWATTSSDNLAATRLLGRSGFRLTTPMAPVVDYEIALPVTSTAGEAARAESFPTSSMTVA